MRLSLIREPRRAKDFSQELAEKGWYHSFELPDGTFIEGYNRIEVLKERYARFPIPRELAGRWVLDIGAWDGWFSFEAERHGADVTAVDCIEIPNFLHIRKTLLSTVSYRIFDFFELPQAGLGKFDFVFFFGVLYHLKHPLLALEIVCALTIDTAIVESFVTDAETWRERQKEIPTMKFLRNGRIGESIGQLDRPYGRLFDGDVPGCRVCPRRIPIRFGRDRGRCVLPEVGASPAGNGTGGAGAARRRPRQKLRREFFNPQRGIHHLLVPHASGVRDS
jgi:SAM-dependent methyltransferase